MDWEHIKNNRVCRFVKHKKAHRLFPVFTWAIGGWFGMLLTPPIGAFFIALSIYSALVMWLPWGKIPRIKLKSLHIYLISAVITLLIVVPLWGKITSLFQEDPYKQLLRTGTADVDITINSKNTITHRRVATWGDWGPLTVGKDGEFILFMELSLPSIRIEPIDPNQVRFTGTLILDVRDKAIDRPISDLSKADYIFLRFKNALTESKVVNGDIVFNFNGGSVQTKIPIPPQQIENETIIVQDVQRYFKK